MWHKVYKKKASPLVVVVNLERVKQKANNKLYLIYVSELPKNLQTNFN